MVTLLQEVHVYTLIHLQFHTDSYYCLAESSLSKHIYFVFSVDSSQSQDSLFDFKQELSNVVTQLCQGMLPYRNQLVIKGTVGVVADSSVRWNFNINSQTKQKQGK